MPLYILAHITREKTPTLLYITQYESPFISLQKITKIKILKAFRLCWLVVIIICLVFFFPPLTIASNSHSNVTQSSSVIHSFKRKIPSRVVCLCDSKTSCSPSSELQPPVNAWMLIKECKFHVSGPRLMHTHTHIRGPEVHERENTHTPTLKYKHKVLEAYIHTNTRTLTQIHRQLKALISLPHPLCCKKIEISQRSK